MIELFLSTDGKHTVHASAQTPEEMATLAPIAKALYRGVLAEFGTKAQLWQSVIKGNGHTSGHARSNGHAQVVNHIDSVAQAQADALPHCPMHQRPMVFRQGRRDHSGPAPCASRMASGARSRKR